MSPELIGAGMLTVLIGVIFIGFPIAFTLLFLALVFGLWGMGARVFDLAFFQAIGLMKEEVLAAVPLFIFMGYVTEQAGLMERLFRAFQVILAPVRGALYLGVILTATVFAMATGIVGAAVTVLGIMAAPIMIKSGYDHRLSAGAIAAGGTLGILIPPSVMLVVMGPVMGASVAKLYAAAFGPGSIEVLSRYETLSGPRLARYTPPILLTRQLSGRRARGGSKKHALDGLGSFSSTRERWVRTPRRRPVRIRVIMPAIIDWAGRNFNADEMDGDGRSKWKGQRRHGGGDPLLLRRADHDGVHLGGHVRAEPHPVRAAAGHPAGPHRPLHAGRRDRRRRERSACWPAGRQGGA
jgi:Tripartite ATP-independent periplasmic transporter, DctM component